MSAFGGVIGFNKTVDAETALVLCEPGLFVEAIVAPDFSSEALELLKTKPKWRENVRLVAVGEMQVVSSEWNYRMISGGVLVQQSDTIPATPLEWKNGDRTSRWGRALG